MTLGKITLPLLAVAAAAIGGVVYTVIEREDACFDAPVAQSSRVEQSSFDQIFRDWNGWRVYSHRVDGRVTETNFENSYGAARHSRFAPTLPNTEGFKALDQAPNFVVFKDLPKGQQAQMVTLEYHVQACPYQFLHVEVHLPVNQGIAPGNSYNGDVHNPRHPPMQEAR